MLLDEKTLAVAAPPVSPEEHLKSAKYMDVIERNSGAPERDARWCVWDTNALDKCRNLARAAFSRWSYTKLYHILVLHGLILRNTWSTFPFPSTDIYSIIIDNVKYYRDARPRFDCILEKDRDACLKAVRDNGADITVIDGGFVKLAIRDYNTKPIIAETYGAGSTKLGERPAVVVIKSGSAINNLGE